jgi:uncharacterized membrane protein
MKQAPIYWHLMLLLGLVMTGIFVYVFKVSYDRLNAAVANQDWPMGSKALGQIRQLIGTNLVLGFLTVGVASLGRLIGSGI